MHLIRQENKLFKLDVVGDSKLEGIVDFVGFSKMNATEDWGADFLSRYTTHSSRHSSPDKSSEFDGLRFGSPIFGSPEKKFCRRENVDQCLAYLNQVKFSFNFLLQPQLFFTWINLTSWNFFDSSFIQLAKYLV